MRRHRPEYPTGTIVAPRQSARPAPGVRNSLVSYRLAHGCPFQYAVITKMGDSPRSPKMSGISSSSRSYRQITQIRRPAGVAANIWNDPSLQSEDQRHGPTRLRPPQATARGPRSLADSTRSRELPHAGAPSSNSFASARHRCIFILIIRASTRLLNRRMPLSQGAWEMYSVPR